MSFLEHILSGFGSLGVCVAVVAAAAATAGGQEEAGRRVYDEQLRVRLDEQLPQAREIGLDAGGWFSFAFFNYDDATARKKRTLRQYELRAWASFNIRGVHRFYARGLGSYEDWNTGTNPDGERSDEFPNPQVERAWYQFDLGQLLRNRTGTRPPVGLRVKVGRAFAKIGTSLVLSMPLDMVQLELEADDWRVMALLGKTIEDSYNIDYSAPVANHQDRCFWGVELTYTGWDHHRPFAYFLSNQDNTDPCPDDPLQSYEYTSQYAGAGSEGTLFLPDLHYRFEVVREYGKTYSDGVTSGRDRIRATAVDGLLEYLFHGPTHPKATVGYLFASGDDDRRLSSSSTIGGNLAGTTDRAFNAFGFRDTGLAFSPLISNLHMYTVGASFFPLEAHKLFKKMEVGTKAFFYHKATDAGPISDTTATKTAQWLGWEWDIFCDWRITSDVTWTLRYGAFQPGSAFEDKSCRQFLLTTLTFSF